MKMAVSTGSTEGQVGKVLEGTRSINTCTPSTLRLLRALLGCQDQTTHHSDNTHEKKAATRKQDSALAAVRSTNRSTKRSNAKFTILESPEPPIPCLSKNKQLALTTNTFNRTLRNLGDAAKAKQAQTLRSSLAGRSPLKETQSRTRDFPPKDLKVATSANPQRVLPQTRNGQAPSSISPDRANLLATTECARVSLQCLRQYKAEGSPKSQQDIQLERGALVLISKLSTLGLKAAAIEETLLLRSTLDKILQVQRRGVYDETGSSGTFSSCASLADCIEFAYAGDNPETFALIMAFQAQVLQLVASDASCSIEQILVQRLNPRNPAGPCQVVLLGVEKSWLPPDKAATQLHSLSQSMLAICPPPLQGSSESSQTGLSQVAQFQVQCLALEMRCHWWRLAKHQPDLEREIWAPFQCFVKLLRRRASETSMSQVLTVQKSLKHLIQAFSGETDTHSSQDMLVRPNAEVLRTLMTMAESTGLATHTLNLLQRLGSFLSDVPGLSTLNYQVRLANAMLSNANTDAKSLTTTLEKVIELLESPMRGSGTDLEDLLVQVSRLQRGVATVVKTKSAKLRTQSGHDQADRGLSNVAVRIIFSVLRLVLRYLNFKSQCADSATRAQNSVSTGENSWMIAQRSVKSTLAAIQLNVMYEHVGWEACVVALTDCLSVSETLSKCAPVASDKQDSIEDTLVTSVAVSNIYWSQYLRQKDAGLNCSDLASTLKRSIDVLKDRSISEKRVGFFGVKCEKAAALYIELKQFKYAHQALLSSIDAHIQMGVLATATQKAATQSTRQMWETVDSAEAVLGRVLSAYSRLLLKQQPESLSWPLFDDAGLQAAQRAVLLERQVLAFKELSIPEALQARLKGVVDTILSLYHDTANVSHQLRFISELLMLCSSCRLHPSQLLPPRGLKLCIDSGSDGSLLRKNTSYASLVCLHLSVQLQWDFQTSKPPTSRVQEFVSSHRQAIESWDAWAVNRSPLNEPVFLLSQVQSVIDFADMLGLLQLKLDTLWLLHRLLELQAERDLSALASCATQIGLIYSRMGLMRKAGQTLASVKALLAQIKSQTLIALQWHLAYAEYLMALSRNDEAANYLTSAEWLYEADFAADHEEGHGGVRLIHHKYLAQAASVASRVAFQQGDLHSAVCHAKKSVRISIRQWLLLERLLGVQYLSQQGASDGKIGELVDELSSMAISGAEQANHCSSKGAPFWGFVQVHVDALLNLSFLSSHNGSFQDAVYYAEQAKKVGQAIGSDLLLCKSSSLLAVHLAEAGQADASKEMIDLCSESCRNIDYAAGSLQIYTAMATSHLAMGDYEIGLKALEEAETAISQIQASDGLTCPFERQLYNAQSHSSTQKPAQPPRRRASKKGQRAGPPSESSHSRTQSCDPRHSGSSRLILATAINNWIQESQAQLYLLQYSLRKRSGSEEGVNDLLIKVGSLRRSSGSQARLSILESRLMLTDVLRLLQSDAVYGMLSDSTIAYPTQLEQQAVVLRECKTKVNVPPKRSGPTPSEVRTWNKQVASRKKPVTPKELISQVQDLLHNAMSLSFSSVTLVVANAFSDLLARTGLLSSLLSASTSPTSLLMICHLNASKSLRWSREMASIKSDLILADKSKVLTWPKNNIYSEVVETASCLDETEVQQRLLHALPPSWVVVNIALSDDNTELLLTKTRPARVPFLLRLPLHRSSFEDLDEEALEFENAKSELLEIIAHANSTAHDAKARADKRGKKEWWATREELDVRLKSLLNAIESLWLGGFRGVLSNVSTDEDALARFSEALSNILDQHLPSRRKTGTKAEPRCQLHSHVVELFVGLGDLDATQLDNAITDLVYFVMDILKFQGEDNAYDEVDLDALVLDVTDALRGYRDASQKVERRAGHTILILDKALHAFPWESLPCLEGQSVSRMPSLNCLQERLHQMREADDSSSGASIDPQNAAYILNPSSDLASTQERFLGAFNSGLTNATSIVNRAPSETEFEACLAEKELCLYFGHGSGGQFIRGRTIRRLKQCALTFLMGCSSSSMVECGQFEPYGVPNNYLHAGAAAVVGTLWDVTDKDIDRFAMATFVNWGLLDRNTVNEPTGSGKAKTKAKTRTKGEKEKEKEKKGKYSGQIPPKGVVGLDEAVAKARDACVLRYLNGAAPVIYGIPAYLKS